MSDKPLKSFSAQVVAMSDSRSSGEREDTVGPLLTGMLENLGAEVGKTIIVPDDKDSIVNILTNLVDKKGIDLIVTTGGTGLAPRDVTPEATREVLTKEIPGLGELMRHEGGVKTVRAYLSRGTGGFRGGSVIINLPGSERGAVQSLEAVLPLLPHAIQTVKGNSQECGSKIGDKDHNHTH